MPKNLMTLDIGTAACDVCLPTYTVAPIEPVQGGAVLMVKGVTEEKEIAKKKLGDPAYLDYVEQERSNILRLASAGNSNHNG